MIVIKNSQLQSSIILTFGEPLHSYVLCEGKESQKIWFDWCIKGEREYNHLLFDEVPLHLHHRFAYPLPNTVDANSN
jgi:hypothetical protein